MEALFGAIVARDNESVVLRADRQARGFDFDCEYESVQPLFQVVDEDLSLFWRNVINDDYWFVFVTVPPLVNAFVEGGLSVGSGLSRFSDSCWSPNPDIFGLEVSVVILKGLLATFIDPGFYRGAIGAPCSGISVSDFGACGSLVDHLVDIVPLVNFLFGFFSELFELTVFFAIVNGLLWCSSGDFPVDPSVVTISPDPVVKLLESHSS